LSNDRQRIDKWLWHARLVRTREAAAALASSGHVRVNGVRIAAASKAVKSGDVVTVALDRGVRVLRVTGFAARRGSAFAAQGLYADLASPAAPNMSVGEGGRAPDCDIGEVPAGRRQTAAPRRDS
jgi:ribosome-associated heat shock protein Hsp15